VQFLKLACQSHNMNTTVDRLDLRAVKPRGVAWKIAALLLIYLLLAAFFNLAWHLLHLPPQMQHGILNPILMVLTGVILLGSILTASAWTAHHFDRRSLATVGVPLSIPWLRQVLIGFLVGSVPPCLFFLAAYKLGSAQVAHVPVDLHYLLTQTMPALAATLLLAFHEELLYRGYLLQVISQKSGRLIAAIITGALFGLVHGGNSAANPQGLLFTAIGGVLLAWLIMGQGSLWMATGYHFGWNATASLALGLQVSGTIMPGSWITTTLTGPRWLSGGTYGFESSIISGLVEPIILGALVWIAPRLPSHPQLRQYFEKRG
jgi:membrane protease YdiL (CAAX protease family)